MTRRQRNNLFIAIMLLAVVFIGVGYALSVQTLEIKGSATIDNTVWKISFTNFEADISDGVTNNTIPSYTETSANININLDKPGAYILYHVTVKNSGTVPAKLYTIRKSEDVNPIVTTIFGINEGDVLAVGEEATFSVTIEWNPDITEIPEGKITENFSFTLDFFQNK